MTDMGRAAGVALLLVLAGTASAEERKPDFGARKEEAIRNFATDAGKRYGESFGKEFAAQYAPTLNACTRETGAPMGDDFDLLLKIGAKGQVEEALVRPETRIADCFRRKARARTYPAPPSAGYWILNGITFSKAPTP